MCIRDSWNTLPHYIVKYYYSVINHGTSANTLRLTQLKTRLLNDLIRHLSLCAIIPASHVLNATEVTTICHFQLISYWSQCLCCFYACMGHKRQPIVCLWQQADNITHCQRMSTDEIPWWASGASLCKRRFNQMASKAHHMLEEYFIN